MKKIALCALTLALSFEACAMKKYFTSEQDNVRCRPVDHVVEFRVGTEPQIFFYIYPSGHIKISGSIMSVFALYLVRSYRGIKLHKDLRIDEGERREDVIKNKLEESFGVSVTMKRIPIK